ncbi:unnamed protein product [Mytilus edulis]|uniref:Uncharacterized protein n=1 Tax=Mytilus edulis TaxID=6550 RepID=A0A8S3Q7L2_MYTED|nr:unnamed protein product [Mytilus edulis]
MDTVAGNRQHETKRKFPNNRLSRYLSKGGRLRVNHHQIPKHMIDEHLLEYKPGSRTDDIQGDGTPPGNIMDNPDSNIQREICCTLGRASSTRRSSCSSRVYVRLVKQNLRLQLKSEQLGLQQQITELDQYKCVLKHKSSFERCCLASKNSQNNKLTRQQQRTTNRRRHLQHRNS